MKRLMDTLNELHSEPVSCGEMVRIYRYGVNLTLKEVEEITGISEAHLSSIENNRIELSLKYAKKLGATFGVHASDLLFPNGKEDDDRDAEIIKIRQKSKEILLKKAS